MAGSGPLLEALFEHVPLGLAVVDERMRYQRVNRVLAEINGRPAGEHIGRTVSEVLGELGGEIEELLGTVLAEGRPVTGLRLTGGTPGDPAADREFVASYHPVPGGVLGVVAEETAARAAEGRAAAASTLLDAVYAAAPVGLAFWTPELRYARINDHLARVNGRPASEHIGRTLAEVLGPLGEEVETALREAIATRRPVETGYAGVVLAGVEGPRDFEATYYPVQDGGRLLGVGAVVRDVTERHAAEAERDRLLRDALVARAHSEAAQVRAEAAHAAAEEARARTEFLAEAGRRMAAAIDSEAIVLQVAGIGVPQVADWAAVRVFDPGPELDEVAVSHPDAAGRRRAAALLAGDADPTELAAELGAASHLALPLTVRGESLGLLVLGRDPGRPGFSPEDRTLAEAFAARAALHVNNARLYSERAHVARTLQAGLLPRGLPEVPGLEVAARYQAAGAHNEVGGDFYDVFETTDGRWVAMVGDVSGKGPEAAAVTSLARHTLRTALGREVDLPAGLAVLNRALSEQAPERFCTVVCAVLEAGGAGTTATVAAAGHPAPLLRRASGEVLEVPAGGSLIGVLPQVEVDLHEVALGPGDLLLMFTDGLTEPRGHPAGFGDAWLADQVRSHGGLPVRELLSELLRGAAALQGGVARDDIAVVGLRAA